MVLIDKTEQPARAPRRPRARRTARQEPAREAAARPAPRAAARPARRSQEERRAATRAALLDAALECLVEHGYEGTTTGRVCERAGVSRGAHLHHFGTRPALVAAALEELAIRRGEDIRREVASLPPGVGRIEHALDAIWGWFTGPLFAASVDLAAAARTDQELRASLAPVERRLSHETLRCCRAMLAADADDRSRDPLIQMTLGTVRGLALLPVLQPGSRSAAKQWAFARERLAELFRAERFAPADAEIPSEVEMRDDGLPAIVAHVLVPSLSIEETRSVIERMRR